MKTNIISTFVSITLLTAVSFALIIAGIVISKPTPVSGQDTSQAQELCRGTNGTWDYDGSAGRCICPSETLWTVQYGCRSEGNLCDDTGGVYAYNGTELICQCPTGYELVASRCEPPENAPGGPLSDATCTDAVLNSENCGIVRIVVFAINFLSALAGIAIIGSLMFSGFQYMTAQDDPGKIQKAKSRIVITFTALLLLIFMTAILNYLIPGGVF